MRRSTSRWSWLETACWLVPTASASSVTVSSPARSRAWMSRRRVSLASSSNRATTSAACRWVSRAPAVPYPGHEPAAWPESCRGSSTLFARGDPEARPEGAGGRMVIGWPPQSRFEMTLVVAFGASRELTWTGTAGTHLVLMDAPRIHHETTTRSLQALSRQNRRSVGVSVEPEGGLEPPTCRLRGGSRPATQIKADRVEQLRRAGRQGRNGSVNGGRLAETLAKQSRLRRTLPQFRQSRLGACSRPSVDWCIALALVDLDDRRQGRSRRNRSHEV